MMRSRHFGLLVLLMAALYPVTARPDDEVGSTSAYVLEGGEGLIAQFAPVFVVEHDEMSYNKIGTPAATVTEGGKEVVPHGSTAMVAQR